MRKRRAAHTQPIPPTYYPHYGAAASRPQKDLSRRARRKLKRQQQPKWRKVTRRILIALVVLLVVFAGLKGYRNIARLTGSKNPFQLFGALNDAPLKTNNGRVNILLAGYSVDDAGHAGATLTDSIMVLSIDQTSKSSVVVSIPRDLYADIPGQGYARINAAYEYGESDKFSESGYPPGGIGLLTKTVHEVTGLDFSYYALINYTAFKDAVNAVGGVSITINSTDKRGVYDPNTNTKLPNGVVQLNGQQALDLSRSRGAGYGSYGFATGDFDRTAYQQAILLALKDKAGSASVLLNPVKLSSLSDSMGNNVKTNMSVGETKSLYNLSKQINNANVKTVGLNKVNGENLLANAIGYGGQYVLIPAAGQDDYTDIQAALLQQFEAAKPAPQAAQ